MEGGLRTASYWVMSRMRSPASAMARGGGGGGGGPAAKGGGPARGFFGST
eukprot:COSAG04_NODE_1795_length_5563_cov_9.186493_1_plen_49_part_10